MSHQIRIHNTKDTSYHLFAKSNPIIEHCSAVTFYPYKCEYGQRQQHLDSTFGEGAKNLFNKVLDFNWHKKDKSPNWNPATEEQINQVEAKVIDQ
jgi:hypothetical protein